MEQFVWVEKYRPKKIEDCILPVDLKQVFLAMIEQGDVNNLLLSGPPGSGKTTVARALLEELGVDYLFIPASMRGNIDTLRNEIANFASSVSFKGKRKYVILDEADYLTHATQPALRNFIEEFSKNCGFILTANFRNKIISAIQSRCQNIDFAFRKTELPKLAAKFFKRTTEILDTEGVKYEKEAVAEFVKKYFPDNRRILNELQGYASTGKIDTGILSNFKAVEIKELLEFMKAKDFTSVRRWVGENLSNDPQVMFKEFYDNGTEYFDPKFLPALVVIIGKYQYQSAFVIDQDINMSACLVEIMVEAVWK